jgi:hypothetical protein
VDAVVPSGHAVYSRVDAPEPVDLRFAVGRSTLTQEHRFVLRGLAEDAGAWTLEVAGLASPEDAARANEALAGDRARAVAAALVAAGLPESQVRLAPPVVAEDGISDPAAWRAARITPVPPAEAP